MCICIYIYIYIYTLHPQEGDKNEGGESPKVVGRPGCVTKGGSPQVGRPSWVVPGGSPGLGRLGGSPGLVAQGGSPRMGRPGRIAGDPPGNTPTDTDTQPEKCLICTPPYPTRPGDTPLGTPPF